MKKSALLAAALIAVMAFGGCGDNGGNDASATPTPTPTQSADVPSADPGDVGTIDTVDLGDVSERNAEGLRVNASTGDDTIFVAIDDWKKTLFNASIEEFNDLYPNINLDLKWFEIANDSVMTALMAARTIPDVIYDFMRPLPDWAALGWVYPLNDLLEGDPDWEYVPQDAKDWRTYNGVVYSLPVRSHTNNMIAINTDLMNELNLDMPAVDWTFDDYKAFLVAGTTDVYSGTENLLSSGLLGSTMVPKLGNYGFDWATQSFDLTTSWLAGINWVNELKAIPGVVASTLRDPDDYWGNADCDYIKKFGDGDIGDGMMAWRMGKTLTFTTSTGSVGDLNNETGMSFEWTLHSFPQVEGVGTRPAMQATNTVVSSTTKYPEAAFEAAKWFSFGERGMISQLDAYGNKEDWDGAQFIIPITNNPAILAKFETLNLVSPGVLHMASSMGNAMHDDLFQMLPAFGDTVDNFLEPLNGQVDAGGDPVALAAEASVKATENHQAQYATWEAKLIATQDAFNAAH